jgi:hypothetical protein
MLVGDVDAHDSCHENSSDTQAYLDSARYYKLKVSGLQAIAVTAG